MFCAFAVTTITGDVYKRQGWGAASTAAPDLREKLILLERANGYIRAVLNLIEAHVSQAGIAIRVE